VELRHLQSLCQLLEQHNSGSAVDDIAPAYCQALPEDLLMQIRTIEGQIDASLFSSVLHDLLVNQLSQATYPPEADLKEYLEYATEEPLEDLEWFVALPEMQLAHTQAVYKLFST
jgi:hypothetical protein